MIVRITLATPSSRAGRASPDSRRRGIHVFCSLATILLAAGTPSYGQCIPDCPDSAWSSLQTDTIPVDGCDSNCRVVVYWKTRRACGSCDIWFQQFRRANDSCDCDDSTFISSAIASFLVRGSYDCPKGTPCWGVWRVVLGGCWYKQLEWPGPEWHYYVCDGADCCLATYLICLNSQGKRVATQTSPPSTLVNCDLLGEECFEACGYLPGGTITEKRRVTPESKGISSRVVPGPAEGYSVILVSGSETDDLALELFDPAGAAVMPRTAIRTVGADVAIDLDISTLSSGSFRYRVTQSANVLATGVLVIAR